MRVMVIIVWTLLVFISIVYGTDFKYNKSSLNFKPCKLFVNDFFMTKRILVQ